MPRTRSFHLRKAKRSWKRPECSKTRRDILKWKSMKNMRISMKRSFKPALKRKSSSRKIRSKSTWHKPLTSKRRWNNRHCSPRRNLQVTSHQSKHQKPSNWAWPISSKSKNSELVKYRISRSKIDIKCWKRNQIWKMEI